MSDEKLIDSHFIYAGRNEDGDRYIYYVLPSLQQNDGTIKAFTQLEKFQVKKKMFKGGSIGAIFKVQLNADTTKVKYNEKQLPIDYWKTEDDIIKWRLNDKTAETMKRAEQQGKSIGDLNKRLEPIKRAYKHANYQQRLAILAEIIRIITS